MSRFQTPSTLSHRDRAHLFAGASPHHTPPASGRSSPFLRQDLGQQRHVDDLEGQNDAMVDGLTAKVQLLKNLTTAIGGELKESALQMTQMNDAFAETGGVLSGTFTRLNNMAARQGCRWLWYIVFLVLVFWFFLFTWWWRR